MITIIFLSNIHFWRVKETSQRDVSFTHPNHMLLLTIIKIDHEYGKCSKITNTLKLRTPKIITENNF